MPARSVAFRIAFLAVAVQTAFKHVTSRVGLLEIAKVACAAAGAHSSDRVRSHPLCRLAAVASKVMLSAMIDASGT
jgi:hypothetical protein